MVIYKIVTKEFHIIELDINPKETTISDLKKLYVEKAKSEGKGNTIVEKFEFKGKILDEKMMVGKLRFNSSAGDMIEVHTKKRSILDML